ncbi:MAG: hypothetical protein ACLR4X_04725 [Clostridia bacterium]
MALLNNSPVRSYIYFENPCIQYNGTIYTINSMYTNKPYIYFDISDPKILKDFDYRQPDENLILVVKNNDGFAMILEGNTALELTFDGINAKTLANKLNSVNKNSQEYKNELSDINDSINSVSDSLIKNNTFNEIKETFNVSTIQLNNKLISLTALIKTSVSDNLLITSEKATINYEYALFEQRAIEVLSQANSLVTIYNANSITIDENSVMAVENNQSELSGVVAELNLQMNEFVNLQTEEVGEGDIAELLGTLEELSALLNTLKDSCNLLIFLGSGNEVVNTTNSLNFRLSTLENIVNELKDQVSSGYEEEKKNVQTIINSDINICNKILSIMRTAVNTEGGQMTNAQKTSLGTYCNGLVNNLNKLKSIYNIYYANKALDDSLKKQFKESMDDFEKKQNNMVNDIDDSIDDLILTPSEWKKYCNYLELFRSARSDLSSKFMSVINLVINSQGSDSIDAINTKIQNINDSIANITQEINTIKNKCDDFDKRLKALEG